MSKQRQNAITTEPAQGLLNLEELIVKYEQVVFMQGEEADAVLEVLDDQGEEAALEYLAQWHNPGEHEVRDESAAGTDDNEFRDGDYILSWNNHFGYIGLQHEI